MDGSLLSRYAAARNSGVKGGRGKIFIIVGVLLVIAVLVSAFSGMFNSGKKRKRSSRKSTGDADVEEEVEYADTGPSCERNKKLKAKEGSLGACDSVSDIDPVGVTFTGSYFKPKAPIRGNSWIHELSSTDNKKEYIAAHQSSDNYCKMVRFQVKKSGDFCRYKTLDAGYFPSEKGQGKSLCTNKINVLDSWSQKNDQTLAFSDKDGGYGIQELKYNKFCD